MRLGEADRPDSRCDWFRVQQVNVVFPVKLFNLRVANKKLGMDDLSKQKLIESP